MAKHVQSKLLLACHIDISNCLVLPAQFHTCFRILVEGELYSFRALPFGWAYSPIICKECLTQMIPRAHARDVVVLIYYDDILVLGFGSRRVQLAADAIVRVLVAEGAIVSPKSKLTPFFEID